MNCKCKSISNPCVDPCGGNYLPMPVCPTLYSYHNQYEGFGGFGGMGHHHKYFELITANHMLQLENNNLRQELCKCAEENKKLKEELDAAKKEIEDLKKEIEDLKNQLEEEKNKKTNCDSVEALLKKEQEKTTDLAKKLDSLKTGVGNANKIEDLDKIKKEIQNQIYDAPVHIIRQHIMS